MVTCFITYPQSQNTKSTGRCNATFSSVNIQIIEGYFYAKPIFLRKMGWWGGFCVARKGRQKDVPFGITSKNIAEREKKTSNSRKKLV